jgi:hypothetical protein
MPRGEKSKNVSFDMSGQIHYRWIVLKRAEGADSKSRKGDTSSKWICKCSCALQTVRVISRRSLLAGRSKSCGCLRIEMNREQAKSIRRPGIESPLRKMIRTYKWNAEKRGLPFELTEEFFLSVITKACFYCGREPAQIRKTIRGTDKEHLLICNGIDRVNNKIGYLESNVVACCGTCNGMKMDKTKSQFLNHINKIYERFHL